jgi:hypothetical protein
MTRTLSAIAAILASTATAQDARVWPGTPSSGYDPSSVTIHAPTAPEAVASVTFRNTEVHAASETFALTWEGLTITVEMEWQVDGQSERITVYPPDGYIAIPPRVTVPERETGVVHVYRWLGG